MTTFTEMGQEFLAHKRIAVAGVSRTPQNTANAIYRKLRDEGYEVFAVNPNADEVEGDRCYATIAGGCPMMFLDFGHKCMRWILDRMGKLPEE